MPSSTVKFPVWGTVSGREYVDGGESLGVWEGKVVEQQVMDQELERHVELAEILFQGSRERFRATHRSAKGEPPEGEIREETGRLIVQPHVRCLEVPSYGAGNGTTQILRYICVEVHHEYVSKVISCGYSVTGRNGKRWK